MRVYFLIIIYHGQKKTENSCLRLDYFQQFSRLLESYNYNLYGRCFKILIIPQGKHSFLIFINK